jgi:competence protein ComEA
LSFGVLALICAVAGAMLSRPSQSVSGEPPQPSPEVTLELVRVHVVGWVAEPGLITVEPGALIGDAIAAAGGLLPGASAASVNLAAEVLDGMQLVVPGPAEDESVTSVSDGLVSINLADAGELETLPGVGPVLAERIVSYREDHGKFSTVEDLLDVPGIGEAKLAALRDLVKP